MSGRANEVLALFSKDLKVINVGLQNFADNLWAKEVTAIHVKWTPPAMGDENLLKLLEKLK